MNAPNCTEIRDLLLDHVYGALDDADAARVEVHLQGCGACRAALADAGRQRDVLAAAARVEAGDVRFAAPRRAVPIFRPLLAASAAAAVVVGAVALGSVGAARAKEVARRPVFDLTGPRTVVQGVPAELRVRAATVDGAPVAARFTSWLPDGKGGWVECGKTTLEGGARESVLAFDPGTLAPGAQTWLRVTMEHLDATGPGTVETKLPLREGTRLVSRVGTDKPLYRPGEVVRTRVVALDGLRFTPGGDGFVRLRMFDPRGGLLLDRRLPTTSGVTAWQHELPADAPGGTYRLVASGVEGGASVAQSEREFQVRAFRAPRLRFDTELDRDSYRPGDRGTAMLKIVRAEGGVPAGASVEAVLRVDGSTASTATLTVAPDGGVVVPFEIPTAVEEGRVALSVTVKDGGAVETTAKTIPLLLDVVRFESFPEGGTLVAGLPNRVYFRARTPADEPADLDAELRDKRGRVVAQVKADVLGMGAFDFVPAAGETYRVVFAATGKPVCEGSALTPGRTGVTLRALDERVGARQPVRVRVAATTGGAYTVGAWCRGVPVGETRVDVPTGGAADVSVPIRTDAGGVLRVTVFDPSGMPVAERLVAREPARKLDVVVTPERAKFAPREHVKVAVKVRDGAGAPAQAILGASVADASALSLADDRDTASMPLHFLLGMEVAELEEAETFASGPKAACAMDRLLAVQGWRRFAWRDPQAFAELHPEQAATVAAVGTDETPNLWTNAAEARAAVEDVTDDATRRSGRGAALFAFAGLFVAGVWVGVRGLQAQRRGVAWAGFSAMGACAVVVVGSALASRTSHGGWEIAALAEAEEVTGFLQGYYEAGGGGGGGGARLDDVATMTASPDEDVDEKAREAGVLRLRDFAFRQAELKADGLAVFGVDALDALTLMPAGGGVGGGPGGGRGGLVLDGAKQPPGEPNGEIERLRALGFVGGDRAELGYILDKNVKQVAQVLVREYAHKAEPADGVRSDDTDVLFWTPLLVTDAQGEASFEFDTSDLVTAFRVDVDAHDGGGALGAGTAEFANRIPFWAEPKFPLALTAGDHLDLPVVIANDGVSAIDVTTTATLAGDLLTARGTLTAALHVAPDARGRVLLPFEARQGRGAATLTIDSTAGAGLRDVRTQKIEVHPRGFPFVVNRSGVVEKLDATTFVLPEKFPRATLRGSLRLYPSTLATLVDGLDSMLREPGGCFEQASSTNYPNVMVLTYLEEQGAAAPDVARRAKDLLGRGYKLLTGYECKRKGYEWFGSDPGHEALTAYGVLEFADMAKVYDVDAAMVARTRDWLLSRRDGKGGFLRDAKSLDSFGGAPQETTDAYVTWALTEADSATVLTAEVDALERRARESSDPYVVALAANALSNRHHAGAGALLDRLASMQRADGGFDAKAVSITSSTGVNLEVESTALAVLAFAKDPKRLAHAESGVRFLLKNRRGGSFGATQATILALRALTVHAKASKRTASEHDLTVFVNDREVARRHVDQGAAGVIEFGEEVIQALRPGENRIEVRTTGAETLPWSLQIEYSTDLPASDPACAVDVTTSLGTVSAREGDAVDLRVTVRNRTDAGQAMTIARVGVPGGLEPRAARLEELKKSGAIDFFELRPREVVLYWRGLAPKAEKSLDLELTASIPGRFTGPASSAYLYYGDDRKTWSAPLECAVEASR